jgi:hypothetical protein
LKSYPIYILTYILQRTYGGVFTDIKIYTGVDYENVKIDEVRAYSNIYTLAIDSLDAGFYNLFFTLNKLAFAK